MSVSRLFENGKRPNILIVITDQERALTHWPENFSREHLPALERLKRHGLDFKHHYTNSCMCSPSRSTLLTSQFPVKTGVTRTGSPGPPITLPTDIPNLATLMKQAGYETVEWHGKWHVGGTPSDYGFEGWQPPDAGNYLSLNSTLGGGDPDNDGRFLNNLCNSLTRHYDDQKKEKEEEHQKEQEQKLDQEDKASKPFCIVASFVNPHDVYVSQHGPALGYTEEDFSKIEVPLPSNLMEDPDKNNKPRSHGQMSHRYVPFESPHQAYINFYAYLHTVVDTQIGTLLDKVDDLGFTDSTLILRTADHGEQGLSHSLVEKFYNCYQESIHIPFIVSNPIAFPEPQSTDALSSHLDIVPTLAALLSSTNDPSNPRIIDRQSFQGRNLTRVLDDPYTTILAPVGINGEKSEAIVGVQHRIHFTYDDISCPGAPSIIRCIHTRKYKYAVYFTPTGRDADWELYDLTADPLENTNLAGNQEYVLLQQQLETELYETMVEMETLPINFKWPPSATPYSQGFDHPPISEEDIKNEDAKEAPSSLASLLSFLQSQQQNNKIKSIDSYAFCDEGVCINIYISMEDIGIQCSEEDIFFNWDRASLSFVVKNYEPGNQTQSLSFSKLSGEITDATYKFAEDKIVITLKKKNPDVEWKSVTFTGDKE